MVNRKPDADRDIREFLCNPCCEADLQSLAMFWRVTRITLIYKRPVDLEVGDRLPSAFRGALGHTLKRVSEERWSAGSQFGSAFLALFADHYKFAEGWHVPKPFVIWITVENNRIYVEISLFGEAGFWRDDVIEAAIRIMLPRDRGGEGGIGLMTGHPTRRVWQLEDVFWREAGSVDVPSPRKTFVLSSITPIITSGQEKVRNSYHSLIFTIFARLAGLARWNSLNAIGNLSFTELNDLVQKIDVAPVLEPRIITETRRSRSYGDKSRREIGLQLDLKIQAFPDELWPGFVLGTFAHIGYDVSQGYGRYRIVE